MTATAPDTTATTLAGKAAAVVRRAHGRPVAGVPRWVVLTAYATSLIPLPSSVWRIALGFGAPLGPTFPNGAELAGDGPLGMPLWTYTILLSVFSEGLAFLTVGLVSGWGEVFPRWMPGLGGRRVPTPAAVIPAGLGAVALTVIFSNAVPSFNDFRLPDGTVGHLGGWRFAAFVGAYAPLPAWGPLLAVVTAAYLLRRTRRPASTA